MDTHSRRRTNLRLLIARDYDGKVLRLAEALDMKPPQLHRWLSKNPESRQNISEHSARAIERALNLPPLYFDQDPATQSTAAVMADFQRLSPKYQAAVASVIQSFLASQQDDIRLEEDGRTDGATNGPIIHDPKHP